MRYSQPYSYVAKKHLVRSRICPSLAPELDIKFASLASNGIGNFVSDDETNANSGGQKNWECEDWSTRAKIIHIQYQQESFSVTGAHVVALYSRIHCAVSAFLSPLWQ